MTSPRFFVGMFFALLLVAPFWTGVGLLVERFA